MAVSKCRLGGGDQIVAGLGDVDCPYPAPARTGLSTRLQSRFQGRLESRLEGRLETKTADLLRCR
jgi:hypothetical protein